MMQHDFTIVIPFRGANCPHRILALQHVLGWLQAQHGWPVFVQVDDDEAAWCKGAVVQRALDQCGDAPGLIIHDADVLVAPGDLSRAVSAVCSGYAWAQPHSHVTRLTRRGTRLAMSGGLAPVGTAPGGTYGRRHAAAAAGGIVVTTRASWELTGGIDRRFVGWGGEDISWARALDTLAGEGFRGDGEMWHLWHPEQPMPHGRRRGSPEVEELAGRYAEAEGDVALMTQLVGE